MGIVRTSSTRILAPYESAYPAVRAAFGAVEIDVPVIANPIVGEMKRSLRKNRWAAAVTAAVRPETPTATVVDWSIDMLGNKHGEVLAEILDVLTAPIDDLGVGDALNRLGKMGRFFGRREALVLTDYVHLDERVVELAQGVYDKRQGMLVLTTQRLFFFDKTLMSAQVEEFDLGAIGSLGFSKSLGGESIDIAISGRSAAISQIAHGRAETFIAAFRQVRSGSSAAGPAPTQQTHSGPDLADQIRKLSELRDAGILTDEEFNAKKVDLLSRM
ncbi:SHOCT domain-containing protein [Mycobacterium sp. GA-1841]|uniref:SHOCT domain-containing protein n=1 Tax=Mycobacterium sp. GA-1841 TaxID=1834154 RepID=UPI001115979A|nr:PH domain-containing protein [Mycobacterium sp. GA-1841]